MHRVLISLVCLVSTSWVAGAYASGGAATGQVCVAPLPDYASSADHDIRGGKPQRREPHYEFTVEIADRDPMDVPKDGKPALVTGLDASHRHRVVIRDRGERIESFWFTFEARGSSRLCLSYTPWYQTWVLDPPRAGARWCACKWLED